MSVNISYVPADRLYTVKRTDTPYLYSSWYFSSRLYKFPPAWAVSDPDHLIRIQTFCLIKIRIQAIAESEFDPDSDQGFYNKIFDKKNCPLCLLKPTKNIYAQGEEASSLTENMKFQKN